MWRVGSVGCVQSSEHTTMSSCRADAFRRLHAPYKMFVGIEIQDDRDHPLSIRLA
jgi:hypothetical protein